jgi:signal transduction histidine kinase
LILTDIQDLRLKLTGKLLVVVAAILVICQLLMSGYLIWQNYRDQQVSHQQYQQNLLGIISSAIAIDTWNFNPGSLEVILAPYRKDPSISELIVQDNDDNVLRILSERPVTSGGSITREIPIIVDMAGLRQQVGLLKVADNQDYIIEKLQMVLWRQMSELILMLFLLALGLTFTLNRLVLKPIKKINSALFQAIISKDTVVHNPVEGLRDEFEEVALSIVALSARLSGDVKLISESRAQLQQEKEKTEVALNDLKLTQEALLHSEKQASLGSLVSGVAHEVNTPLGIIITSVTCMSDLVFKIEQDLKDNKLSRQVLQDRMGQLHEAVDLITHNSDRASSLVTNFKLLAKEQTNESARWFNLSALLREVVQSQQGILQQAHVQVLMDFAADVQLNSIPGLFNQLVCALLNNVVQHAYPSGMGGICCLKLQSFDDELILSCTDEGIGISQEQQKHVFDPFFTTKLGSGTSGLGLAIVYRIVRSNLGGSIRVKSQLKEGTCFEIRFPRHFLL